jgi:hypothetical protein
VRTGLASTHSTIVLDIVNEQRSIVEFTNDGLHGFDLVGTALEPDLKGIEEKPTDVFPRHPHNVVPRSEDNLIF